MDLKTSIDLFDKRCIALNLSDKSIFLYNRVLSRFGKYMQEQKLKNVEDVSSQHLRNYISDLSLTMNDTTRKIHFMCLRVFYNFLFRDCLITDNPIKNIETPKVARKELKTFSRLELKQIMASFDLSTFLGYRNYTIMSIFFGTGIRRAELANLYISSIHFDINTIKVMGKGNKFRNIPLSANLRKTIIRYLKLRDEYIEEKNLYKSPYLIISASGEKLQENSYSDLFRVIAHENNISNVRVSPHTFRHTFAKLFLLNGGDVFTLQKILGHSDIGITRQYVNLNTTEIKVQNDKYNPLENESWKYLI